MKKYIYLGILLLVCSCSSGLTDSKALKIARETQGFSTVEGIFLRINDIMAAVPDSEYIVEGTDILKRSKSDELIHIFDPYNFIISNIIDEDGNLLQIEGGDLIMKWENKLNNVCAGCEFCYEKFKEKDLLNVNWNAGIDEFGFRHGNVSLTDTGQKYLIKWANPEEGNMIMSSYLYANTGDAIAVELMRRVYTGAEKVYESGDRAIFYLNYYLKFTPFGEALWGETKKEPGYKSKATYEKDSEGKWRLVSLEDLGNPNRKREF